MAARGQLAVETAGTFPLAATVFAVALAATHVFAGRLVDADHEWGRRGLSFAAGASVAYVFVLLLPEVSEAALEFGELRGESLLAEQLVYAAALVGFVGFYGLEVVARHDLEKTEQDSLVFGISLASFALYSALVAYLLYHQEVPGVLNLALYAAAMALHFAITDHGLRRHLGATYDRFGRWVLAGATLFGAVIGLTGGGEGFVVPVLFGFLAGGIIFNTIKEELPDASRGRLVAFVVGTLVLAVVVLLYEVVGVV